MSYTALSHGGVARVSTMVVDAPLDMGGFPFVGDVCTIKRGHFDLLDELTAGDGLLLRHLGTFDRFRTIASDVTRVSSLPVVTYASTGGVYTVSDWTQKIPLLYTEAGTVRVVWSARGNTPGTYNRKTKIRVNGVSVPGTEHQNDTDVWETYTHDIPCEGGDIIAICYSLTAAAIQIKDGYIRASDEAAVVDFNQPWNVPIA